MQFLIRRNDNGKTKQKRMQNETILKANRQPFITRATRGPLTKPGDDGTQTTISWG